MPKYLVINTWVEVAQLLVDADSREKAIEKAKDGVEDWDTGDTEFVSEMNSMTACEVEEEYEHPDQTVERKTLVEALEALGMNLGPKADDDD